MRRLQEGKGNSDCMIPRKIINKIRQSEMRESRIAAEPLASASLKPAAQSVGIPAGMPFQGLKIIQTGRRFEPQPFHFQPKRLRASARTCSHGMPAFGFFRSSSARRSSSAFCSGVSSSLKSPNSRSMVSTSSRRSASGIRRSSSRISVLLMAAIYSFDWPAQAGFFAGSKSAIYNRPSPISP